MRLISVITPSLNSGTYLEDAITSVLTQRYASFEHIVVDGGSTDGTLQVLETYPHIRFISEKDEGQSDAMNKGFAMARGDIIVYLNADDYFEPGAFQAVAAAFDTGARFVVGRVRVLRSDGLHFINDPKVRIPDMLRWWQNDAFCYNSAGYFYAREIQASVGVFNVNDHYAMDFEFLIEAARRVNFSRIPQILASFRLFPGTKTFNNTANELATMRRFYRYIDLLEPADRVAYEEEYSARFGVDELP